MFGTITSGLRFFLEPINDPLPETKQSHLKHQCWMSKFPFWQKASHVRSLNSRERCKLSKPIASVYGLFTYISHKNPPNVGKYTIHAGMGNGSMVGSSIMIGESDPVQVGVE